MPEIYILPDKFHGRIFICWDEKDGAPIEYQGKWPFRWRVYRVPKSGVFRTQFHRCNGAVDTSNQRAYYQKPDGSLLRIKYCSPYFTSCSPGDSLNSNDEIFMRIGDGGNAEINDSFTYLQLKKIRPKGWDTTMPVIKLSFNTMRISTINHPPGEKNLEINSEQYHNWNR